MGIVIVAPAETAWAVRATRAIAAAGLHVAWIRDLRALGVLLGRGGVRAVAIDAKLRGPSWALESMRIGRLAPAARIMVVRDDGAPEAPDAIACPDAPEEIVRLVAPAAAPA